MWFPKTTIHVTLGVYILWSNQQSGILFYILSFLAHLDTHICSVAPLSDLLQKMYEKYFYVDFNHFNIALNILIGVKSSSDISNIHVIPSSHSTQWEKHIFQLRARKDGLFSSPPRLSVPTCSSARTHSTCAVHPCTGPKFPFFELTSGLYCSFYCSFEPSSPALNFELFTLPARTLTSAGLLLLTVPAEQSLQ